MDTERKVLILGSGCAGLTAAIYTARANLKPLVIEGLQPGGQLATTTEVENFPGFEHGVQGPDLMTTMRAQAKRFGTEIVMDEITAVDLKARPFRVIGGEGETRCESLIIATGASAKMIGLDKEKKLIGRGVSTCATCDGAFFKNKPIVVVGGGDSAMEEAIFLTRFGSSVVVVHRRDKLRASKIMQDRASKNPKITFAWNSVVEDIKDQGGKVGGVVLRNIVTKELTETPCEGLFVAIGHKPNSELFKGVLDMDEVGYLKTVNGTSATKIPGVFAAGDVVDRRYRQAVTAAGMGCMSAIDAERYLESLE
ncbi:MAG: thioredoxin-disulfide reductase [Nitrospirae bacterium]|nr:thioredoxin-disulfide reductase [Nitrospirota bacterium]